MTEQEFNEVALFYKYQEPFMPFFIETKDGREFFLDKDAGLIWNPPAVGVISSDDMIYDFWIEDVVKFRPANDELLLLEFNQSHLRSPRRHAGDFW